MTFERDTHDGLTDVERSVMALWDRDASIEQIAAELSLPRHRVGKIVAEFHIGGPDDQTSALVAAAALANANYLAALAAAGGCYR